jgi:hypothetical protein
MMMMNYFPLTLTLSRGEREQQLMRFNFSEALSAHSTARFFMRRDMILLLPVGEGRGEGDDSRISNKTP